MFKLSEYPALAERCTQAEIGDTFFASNHFTPLKEIGDALRAKWPDRRYILKQLPEGDLRVTRMPFHAPSDDESPAGPTTPHDAVVMLQHIINLFTDEPDVIFAAAVAIADIATEAANNGTIVDPLMGSDFVPLSPAK